MTKTIQYLMVLVATVKIPNQITIATFRKMFKIYKSVLSYKENPTISLHVPHVF